MGHLSLAHMGNLESVIVIDIDFNFYEGGADDDKDDWGGFVK